MSLPEAILWQALRGKRMTGLRFRRQHPIGPYIIDFFCPTARLAVEVDGATHDDPEQAVHDTQRDAWLTQRGVNLLRFPAGDVLDEKRLEGRVARDRASGCPLHRLRQSPSTASWGRNKHGAADATPFAGELSAKPTEGAGPRTRLPKACARQAPSTMLRMVPLPPRRGGGTANKTAPEIQ